MDSLKNSYQKKIRRCKTMQTILVVFLTFVLIGAAMAVNFVATR